MTKYQSSRHSSQNSFIPSPPDGRSHGTLSQAIRELLCRQGGRCTRDSIRIALEADAHLRGRLHDGQGLARLLRNMQYSGFVMIDGETVTATSRTLHRTMAARHQLAGAEGVALTRTQGVGGISAGSTGKRHQDQRHEEADPSR